MENKNNEISLFQLWLNCDWKIKFIFMLGFLFIFGLMNLYKIVLGGSFFLIFYIFYKTFQDNNK